MSREQQIYNALVIFADLIGERVAAHMKGEQPMCPPEETLLSVEEAADLFAEWQRKLAEGENVDN